MENAGKKSQVNIDVRNGVKFIADSGASSHMVSKHNTRCMHSITPEPRTITTANGTMYSSAKGTLGSLSNVLIVSDINDNLFSIPQAV